MPVIDQQRQQQADSFKLTAVTIGHGSQRVQFFARLKHNSRGEAILPQHVLDRHLDRLGVQRGQAYTLG